MLYHKRGIDIKNKEVYRQANCSWFWGSTPTETSAVAKAAEGVIIGSAIVKKFMRLQMNWRVILTVLERLYNEQCY